MMIIISFCVLHHIVITLVHMYIGIAGSLNFKSLYINILAVKLTFRYSFFTSICEHCLCVWSLWCWTRNTMFLVSRSWLTFETRLSARLTMSLLVSSVIILTSSWTSSQRLASCHVVLLDSTTGTKAFCIKCQRQMVHVQCQDHSFMMNCHMMCYCHHMRNICCWHFIWKDSGFQAHLPV